MTFAHLNYQNLCFNIILIDCRKFFATSLPNPLKPIPIIPEAHQIKTFTFRISKHLAYKEHTCTLHKAVKVWKAITTNTKKLILSYHKFVISVKEMLFSRYTDNN